MSFEPYSLTLTGDPETDDRLLSEYQNKLKEWRRAEDEAAEIAEIADLSASFISDNPEAYAEAFDALGRTKRPFWEIFEAIPVGGGKFEIRLRRGTIQ